MQRLMAGCEVEYEGTECCLPLRIRGGGLPGGRMEVAADLSSQYVSSILIAAPYAREPVTLVLASATVVSEPYIDMTVDMMRGVTGYTLVLGLDRLSVLNPVRFPRFLHGRGRSVWL